MKDGEVEVEIISKYENLSVIRSLVREFLEVENVSRLDIVQLVSVVDELSTNVVEHAYAKSKNERNMIKISAKRVEEEISLSVEDFGDGIVEGKKNKEEGGLGLNIVKGIVDNFNIIKKDKGVKVEILKKIKKEDKEDVN